MFDVRKQGWRDGFYNQQAKVDSLSSAPEKTMTWWIFARSFCILCSWNWRQSNSFALQDSPCRPIDPRVLHHHMFVTEHTACFVETRILKFAVRNGP